MSEDEGVRRGLDLCVAASDEAQAAALRVVLLHMLDRLDVHVPDSEQ